MVRIFLEKILFSEPFPSDLFCLRLTDERDKDDGSKWQDDKNMANRTSCSACF